MVHGLSPWPLASKPSTTYLLLHELLELGDLLSVPGVLGDVILIKEGLGKGRPGQEDPSRGYYLDGAQGACVPRCHLEGRWAASSQVHTPMYLQSTSCLQSQVCFLCLRRADGGQVI